MPGRGGRGGGRGGRGRGGGAPGGSRIIGNVPFAVDNEIKLDGKPTELFPTYYNSPHFPPLSHKEEKIVSNFLLFRAQAHESPLNTHGRSTASAAKDVSSAGQGRAYTQDQINGSYKTKDADPFTAVPTYSQQFLPPERTLPDFSSRPFAKEVFPEELHTTLEGLDGDAEMASRKKKKRVVALSSITALRTAQDVFGPGYDVALDMINQWEKGGEEEEEDVLEEEEDEDEGQEEDDDDYGDEELDGDYDAEKYFNDGDEDDGEDDDDGGGGSY